MSNDSEENTEEMSTKTKNHIISVLRRGTITWPARAECLNKNRVRIKVGVFKNGKNKMVWKYPCEECEEMFNKEDLEVDHKIEVGPHTGDWNRFIRRLYCSLNNLQALCISCHERKTSKFNAMLRFARKEL
jgi:5-methylcytosine-specific restriction endonuclease McrA